MTLSSTTTIELPDSPPSHSSTLSSAQHILNKTIRHSLSRVYPRYLDITL